MLEKTELTWIGTIVAKAGNLIENTQEIIVALAGIIVVIMVVIGGIQYITGQPDAGKKTITAAIIGSIIIVLSWTIYKTICTLFPILN